jgi:hypothetical protein
VFYLKEVYLQNNGVHLSHYFYIHELQQRAAERRLQFVAPHLAVFSAAQHNVAADDAPVAAEADGVKKTQRRQGTMTPAEMQVCVLRKLRHGGETKIVEVVHSCLLAILQLNEGGDKMS